MVNKKEETNFISTTDDNKISMKKTPTKEVTTKKNKTTRPKPFYFWSNTEVMKWLWRQCTTYFTLYGQIFIDNDITGRTLVRMTETTLQNLGITKDDHREELWQEILKLRLKIDILEMREMEAKGYKLIATK